MSDYQEKTKPCPICENGIITIPMPDGTIHQDTCKVYGGTGRVRK